MISDFLQNLSLEFKEFDEVESITKPSGTWVCWSSQGDLQNYFGERGSHMMHRSGMGKTCTVTVGLWRGKRLRKVADVKYRFIVTRDEWQSQCETILSFLDALNEGMAAPVVGKEIKKRDRWKVIQEAVSDFDEVKRSYGKKFVKQIEPYVYLLRDPKTGITLVKNDRAGCGHSPHPDIDATGSVSGMKKLEYWKKEDRTARAFGSHFNLDGFRVSGELDEIAAQECLCVACSERRLFAQSTLVKVSVEGESDREMLLQEFFLEMEISEQERFNFCGTLKVCRKLNLHWRDPRIVVNLEGLTGKLGLKPRPLGRLLL